MTISRSSRAAGTRRDGARRARRQCRVDIILLDLEMPGVDGLTALPGSDRRGRRRAVLIVSSLGRGRRRADASQALALGAADTLVKPAPAHFAGRFAEVLAERLTAHRLRRARAAPAAPWPTRRRRSAARRCAGEPTRLRRDRRLDRRHPCARRSSCARCPRAYRRADPGHPASAARRSCPISRAQLGRARRPPMRGRRRRHAASRPDRILVAPGDAHICCVEPATDGAASGSTASAAPSGCMPSVDPMLASVGGRLRRRARSAWC